MRKFALRILVLVFSCVSVAMGAATPMDAPLKEGGLTTIECDVLDKKEVLTFFKHLESKVCEKTEGYHYKLYLPNGYQANKDYKYPCMFISSISGLSGRCCWLDPVLLSY